MEGLLFLARSTTFFFIDPTDSQYCESGNTIDLGTIFMAVLSANSEALIAGVIIDPTASVPMKQERYQHSEGDSRTR